MTGIPEHERNQQLSEAVSNPELTDDDRERVQRQLLADGIDPHVFAVGGLVNRPVSASWPIRW
jgi:hypothetical protein